MSFDTTQKEFPYQRFASFVCFALVLFLALTSKAERLPVKTYTVADGLLRDNVYKIKQDSRGFLWFCTEEGISRFDGYAFTNFTTGDGLPDRHVNDFLETKNGTIYIATGQGLARLNPHGLRDSTENPLFTVSIPDNRKAEKILTLYQDNSNQVWVGTSDGLYKLIEMGAMAFENVPLGEPLAFIGGAIAEPGTNTLYINTILEDRRGMLWIGTFRSGLFRLSQDGSVRRFSADDDGFGDNKITVLVGDREGRIWMGMRSDEEGGLCLLDAEANEHPVRTCYRTKDGLPANRILDMLETSDGQMWLATSRSLCRWQGEDNTSVCKTYTAKNDLCDEVFALAEDREGNLWTGSPCGAKKSPVTALRPTTSRAGLIITWSMRYL